MSKPPLKSVEEKTRIVLAVLRGEVTVASGVVERVGHNRL